LRDRHAFASKQQNDLTLGRNVIGCDDVLDQR